MRDNGALTLSGYKAQIIEGFMANIDDATIKAAAQKYIDAHNKDIEAGYKWYLNGSKSSSPNAVIYELDLDFVPEEWI